MATILKELYGLRLSYLKIKQQKSIFDLISHLPNYGRGTLVQPTDWFRDGRTLNYYKVTSVLAGKKKVMGIRYRNGIAGSSEHELTDGKFTRWGFYTHPDDIKRIHSVILK
ncbi:hypothetical protein BC833DRAFT_651339 [Globomyces pollinis-pini]|nr:hypothetical protein BC833DRAFT_651339 [Globomyces pollinis-pini]